MSGVISSLFGIFRLLQMAPDGLKGMKNTRRPDFILVIWTSVALFLESIGINTYIDQSSIWLEHEYKISCLFSLCTTPSSGTLDRIIPLSWKSPLSFANITSLQLTIKVEIPHFLATAIISYLKHDVSPLDNAEDDRLDGYYCKVKLWQDNFWKKPKKIITKSLNGRNVTLSKEAKLSHSWMVLTAVSWEHSGIFCYYFLIFWQNIPLCSQLSAVSTIQLWLNLASLKSK